MTWSKHHSLRRIALGLVAAALVPAGRPGPSPGRER